MRTPSAHSATSRREWSTGSRGLTVPVGPHLETELRSRGRSTSWSQRGQFPGTPETFRSCSSARGGSVRSASRELTVPVGPLLRTEMRSWSRDVYSDRLYSKCSSREQVLAAVTPPSPCRPSSDLITAALVAVERARSSSKEHDSKPLDRQTTNGSTEQGKATESAEAEVFEATVLQANVDHTSLERIDAPNTSPIVVATATCERVQAETIPLKVEAVPEAAVVEQCKITDLQANLDGSSLQARDDTKEAAAEAQSETAVPDAEATLQAGEEEQPEAADSNAHVDHICLELVDAANALFEKVQSEAAGPKTEEGRVCAAETPAAADELQNCTCSQEGPASVTVASASVFEARPPRKAAGSKSSQSTVQHRQASDAAALKEVDDATPVATTPGKLSPTLRATCKKEEVLAKVAQDQESKKKKLFVFGKSPMNSSTNQVKK